MARHPDPTARLRPLLTGARRSPSAEEPDQVRSGVRDAEHTVDGAADVAGDAAGEGGPAARGWVPQWGAPAPGGAGGSTAAEPPDPPPEPFDDALADGGPADISLPPVRWRRLRERWLPEPLQHARLDPGRRGALLLSLVAAVAAAVAAVGVWTGGPQRGAVQPVSTLTSPVSGPEPVPAEPSASVSSAAAPATILVSVTGAVQRPGLVTLPSGARVADAITAAGGLRDGTDITGLNLAAKLADGDSVVVGGAGAGVQTDPGAATGPAAGTGQLVDLNAADQATLETLPGVGPVTAANILAWRTQNGPFTSVDQLREVSGIGPSRFATLAPLVTV